MVGGGGAAPVIVLVEQGQCAPGSRIRLIEGESHHLRVRRARLGESVDLRDGAGLVGVGTLTESGRDWEVVVERAERRAAPGALALAVGAGDRDRFAAVVEKAVELGVTAIVPVVTDRVAGVATRLRPAHLEKLGRMALESVKQSGNPWACTMQGAVSLADFLARPETGTRWLADPAGAPPASTLPAFEAVAVLVGPEGGLTASERDASIGAGFRPVALGPHILRFETAALAAAAAVPAARLRGRDG